MASAYFQQMMAVLAAGGINPYMMTSNRILFATGATTAVSSGSEYEAVKITLPALPYERRSPRFTFFAGYCVGYSVDPEIAIGNDIYHEGVALEISGVRTPLTVNGSAAFNLPNGTYVHTDENDLVIPAGVAPAILLATYVPIGGVRPTGAFFSQSSGDGRNAGSTTQSGRLTSGTFSTPSRSTSLYGPCMMVAKGWAAAGRPPVPLVVGDSIAWSVGDHNIYWAPEGVFGYINRALNDSASSTKYAYGNFASPGEKAAHLVNSAGKWQMRRQMLADFDWPFTSVIMEGGINDTSLSVPSWISTYNAGLLFLKGMGGKNTAALPMTPKCVTLTAASVGWTTLGNQSRTDATTMDGGNAHIRSQPVNVDVVIDAAAAVESAGKWVVSGYYASTLTADVSSGTSISLANAVPLDEFILVGTGTANYERRRVYTGGTTATLNSAIAKAHLSGDAVNGEPTTDGVHPSTRAAIALSVPVIAAKVAGLIV